MNTVGANDKGKPLDGRETVVYMAIQPATVHLQSAADDDSVLSTNTPFFLHCVMSTFNDGTIWAQFTTKALQTGI